VRVEVLRFVRRCRTVAARTSGHPEVKRRSPSKGWIGEHLDAAALAGDYQQGGARAIRWLTDGPHFAGRSEISRPFARPRVPILRKDFTVSANVLDAAAMGASAVLLIVAALSDAELILFYDVATRADSYALVEVHDRTRTGRRARAGGDHHRRQPT